MDISDEIVELAAKAMIHAMNNAEPDSAEWRHLGNSDRDVARYLVRAALASAAPALIKKTAAQDKALEDIAALDPTSMTLGDCIFAVTSARAAIRARMTKGAEVHSSCGDVFADLNVAPDPRACITKDTAP